MDCELIPYITGTENNNKLFDVLSEDNPKILKTEATDEFTLAVVIGDVGKVKAEPLKLFAVTLKAAAAIFVRVDTPIDCPGVETGVTASKESVSANESVEKVLSSR